MGPWWFTRANMQEWLNMLWGDGSKRALYAYLYGAASSRRLTEDAEGDDSGRGGTGRRTGFRFQSRQIPAP
jgi:hypothetical protein